MRDRHSETTRPEVARRVSDLFAALGGRVEAAAAAPFAGPRDLLGAEREVVAGAVAKRVAEFATGRVLARRALARLGMPPAALPARADRAPEWPPGVVGTLAHTDELCVAACAHAAAFAAIGLDLEPDRPLDPELLDQVLRPEERATLAPRDALAAFCAKEAVYKCQHRLSGRMLEFHDVHLELRDDRFVATVLVAADDAPWRRLAGRLARCADHLLAAAALPT